MKEKILKLGILMPLIIGIVLAIAFFGFLHHTTLLTPVSKGTLMAYHDQLGVSSEIVKVDKHSDYSTNDVMGQIDVGNDAVAVRYNADYIYLASDISFFGGTEFGSGVSYVTSNYTVAQELQKSKRFVYNGATGEHEYKFVESKTYPSKYSAMVDALDIDYGIVLLYQRIENHGLSSDYTALIFEEVA